MNNKLNINSKSNLSTIVKIDDGFLLPNNDSNVEIKIIFSGNRNIKEIVKFESELYELITKYDK